MRRLVLSILTNILVPILCSTFTPWDPPKVCTCFLMLGLLKTYCLVIFFIRKVVFWFVIYLHISFTENGFVQGIRISDNRGKMYDNIVEQLQYHYLKVFDVPFDEVSTSFIFLLFFFCYLTCNILKKGF